MSGRKRFYKEVTVTGDRGIALDGRPLRTPKKAPLNLPTPLLAEAIAEEWRGQGEHLDPHGMTLTKLANTAIDRVAAERPRILAEMVDYAGSDLVCYRADRPPDLVARQEAHWNPVLAWTLTELDAPFAVQKGVMHRKQAEEALRAVATALSDRSEFEIAALHSFMTLTGSALIALMLAGRAISPDEAWTAAHVDEDYQIAHWGEDQEAAERRAARLTEFRACCRFLALCR